MIDKLHVPAAFTQFRQRWSERDERMVIMDEVVTGEWMALDPDDDELENRSPNLVQVALEDTAEAASLMPTVRIVPSKATDGAKKRSAAMERMAASYMDRSQSEILTIDSLLDLAGHGFFVWVVEQDPESKSPVIVWRNPRNCYPEPGWRPGDPVKRCMFAREVYVSQLPADHQRTVATEVPHWDADDPAFINHKVLLVEIFEDDAVSVWALAQGSAIVSPLSAQRDVSYTPVLLETRETPGGICPVVIGQRRTFDHEPRGQFDQVIPVMKAHIRLMGMVLDYADQAVYSDVWVKDLIGQMPYGGGAYIQLGPQGSIGRVPPAVSSLQVDQQLEQLINNIHLGGRWPKSRPGEIDQAIASAKFIEATTGMMNTVIRTYHLILKRAWEQALRICLVQDKVSGNELTVSGVLRNQQFLEGRSVDDIDLGARVRVEYGLGLGRDPAQAMVMGIQASGAGIVSLEFVQENFEGITDVSRERQRIGRQQFEDMAKAQLLQGLQDKSIPPTVLAQIVRAIDKGDDIIELFDKFVAKPQSDIQDAMLGSGLNPGEQLSPGMAPPGAAGPQAPPPPDAGGLLAGLAANGGPPPEEGGPETINRLSVPLGNGSFAGSQMRG